jgi:hypothetical protein
MQVVFYEYLSQGFALTVAGTLSMASLAACCPGLAPASEPTAETGAGVLVGAFESTRSAQGRSRVAGEILALDGRRVCVGPRSEIPVAPGCYLVEAEFDYKLSRPDRDNPCLAFKAFGACDKRADYNSGTTWFALPVRAGRRYELSALLDGERVWAHFVEVDPEQGTVARFPPVHPATRACSPGIPVGAVHAPRTGFAQLESDLAGVLASGDRGAAGDCWQPSRAARSDHARNWLPVMIPLQRQLQAQ